MVIVTALVPVVGDADLLVTGGLPEELLDGQVQRPERDAHPVAVEQVGVGQMGDQPVVFLVNGGAEKERPLALELEDRTGQEARALVKEPLFAQPAGHRVAVAVEDGEGLAVLEDAGLCLGQAGGRQQVIRSEVGGIQLWLALLGFDRSGPSASHLLSAASCSAINRS